MEHLLSMLEMSEQDIVDVLDLADKLKAERKQGIFTPYLKNKKIGLIFKKSSTRTRVSFEVGAVELGAYPLFIDSKTSQMGRGEPVQDTARVLSRYLDGIMIRTFEQQEVEDLAKYGSVPLINGLTDFAHPCQVLADLQTIRETKGTLEGLKMCYIGDGNNMCNSLMVGALKTGMRFSCACPKGYEPDPKVLEFAKAYGDKFELCTDPKQAAQGADVVLTDVWASMGEENEAEERRKVFEGIYQVNADLMNVTNDGCMVLHCLPAHRGEEITEEVFEAHADEIFEEAENRLHAQKAVMVKVMAD